MYNAESPRRYVYGMPPYREEGVHGIHIRRTSLLQSALPDGQKLRSFETRKPDACKRLLYI